MSSSDLLVHGGDVVSPDGVTKSDVLIRSGRVVRVAPSIEAPEDVPRLDATGKWVFPGVIDPQVHFREPGAPHKEDLGSGSLAAIAGGVTSFMEMPNTRPPTTTPEALDDKLARAAEKCWADHAFFVGATAENADDLGELEQRPGCAGVKVFMGSSTGTLLVPDDETLRRVLASGSRRVAVHSEDEDRLRARYAEFAEGATVHQHPHIRDVEAALRATKRLLAVVEETGRPIHLLHVSTKDEIDFLRERGLGDRVSAEVTPNHLFLQAPDCYERWGSLVQMNPPVRDRGHQLALREALKEGTLWCIGSDHAPHHLDEKALPYPKSPSGIPGVQTILPLLLTAVRDGWLDLTDIPRIICEGPARAYGIAGKGALRPGYDGDLVVVDPNEQGPLPLEWLRSRAAYSPYVGMRLAGWPETTVLRGRIVYHDHAPVGEPSGRPLSFDSA